MIPKIIHQSWKTEDLASYGENARISDIAIRSQESWKTLYPDFEYKFWTDDDIEVFVQKQEDKIKDVFYGMDENIKKMDFFRYLILHEFGGIYSDLDFTVQSRIDEEILNAYDFIGYKAPRNPSNGVTISYYTRAGIEDKTQSDIDGYKWVLGNAFFGCSAKNFKLKTLIEALCDKNAVEYGKNVLIHTSPERINSVFVDNDFFKDTYVFSKSEIRNNVGTIGSHFCQQQWNSPV